MNERDTLRVFIPIEGTPFIHPSDGDRETVEIPLQVPLPSHTGDGTSDSKFTTKHPSRRFHRLKIRHGPQCHCYVYAEELLNPPVMT